MKPKKILLYIVYGDNVVYYTGAKFSILTFSRFIPKHENIEIVVLTEKPIEFESYPVTIITITKERQQEWSLNNRYHFRIKNRAMAYAINYLGLKNNDKVLFFDTDSYFKKSPIGLFDLITNKQAVFYLREGLIYAKKRYRVYVDSLENNPIQVDSEIYLLSKDSALWGSAIIGITASMKHSLDFADKLMLKFLDIVDSHTIEPFALSETLLKDYKMVEGKHLVNLYSTSAKKEYAKCILNKFFKKYDNLSFNKQLKKAKKVNLRRPIVVVIKQKLKKLFTTGESLW